MAEFSIFAGLSGIKIRVAFAAGSSRHAGQGRYNRTSDVPVVSNNGGAINNRGILLEITIPLENVSGT